MAHSIDITNGQASFVAAREDAWHRLGTTLDHSFTAEEAMTEGHLGGWNVRKTPAHTVVDGKTYPMVGRNAVVRDNPVNGKIDVLGDVGDSYTVIQNEEHAGLLNALVDESGAHFETAGAINGGRQVFITMKLPGHISIGGVDRIENYIAAVNSHDGSSSFTMMVTPVRIVCENTLNMAFGQHKSSFRVRHTRGAGRILINEARKALDMTFNYLDGFQEEAERLINTTMTQSAFEELIAREFGAPEDAPQATVTRRENQIDQMLTLFSDSYTHAGVRETAWAGLNALTEWYDHFSATKGREPGEARALNALFYPEFKDKARALVMAEVGLA